MPERLQGLVVERVAFVPRGDNPEAHVVLYKAHPDDVSEEDSMGEVDKAARLTPKKRNALLAAIDAIRGVAGPGEGEEDRMGDGTEKYQLPEDAPDELVAFVEGIQKERDDAIAAAAEAAKATDEGEGEGSGDDGDELSKALTEVPAVVKDALQKAQADADAANERITKMEEAARQERAAEFVKGLGHLPKAATLAPLLEKLESTDPELHAEVARVLTSVNGLANEAMGEIGKGSAAADTTEGAVAFEQMRKEYMDAHPDVTREQAAAKVLATREGKEAYALHEAERREA